MAADWIKLEKTTLAKPEVLRVAIELGIHPMHAFGLCVRFWCWADDQLSDGHAPGVTKEVLDLILCHAGLCEALITVGWLRVREGSLEVPHFDRHLSQSAKNRALANDRKAKQRDAKREPRHRPAAVSRAERDTSVTRVESESKSKSNKKTNNKHPHFENAEFAEQFEIFLAQSQRTHHWIAGEEVQQQWLYELTRHSPEDAAAMLRFSTGAGAKKPIWNGDHSRTRGASAAKQTSKRLEVVRD